MGVEAVWHSKLLNDFIDNNLASGATRYSSIPAAEGHIKPVRVGRECESHFMDSISCIPKTLQYGIYIDYDG